MREKRNRPAEEQRKREQEVEDSLDAFLNASLPENEDNDWIPPVLTPEDFEALVLTAPIPPKGADLPDLPQEEPTKNSVAMGIHLNLNQTEGEILLKLRKVLSPHFQNSDFPTDQKILLTLLQMATKDFDNPDWLKQFQRILSR